MQTPDSSQTSVPQIKCANPDCDEYFEATGKRKYHDPKCRWGLTANLRQHISRLARRHEPIASDEEMLALLVRLARCPTSPGELRDATWHELNELDRILYIQGPIPHIRRQIKSKVDAIRRELMLRRPKTSDEALQYIFCLEILIDVGAETPTNVPRLRQYAWEVLQFYLRKKDYKSLSRAVIVYANNWRLDNHDCQGKHFYRSPLQILREYQGERDINYWILLHNAMVWNLRFFGEYWSRQEQEKTMEDLIALTRDVGTPAIRLDTHKVLAAYWNSMKERDRALEHCHEIEQSLLKNSFPLHELLALRRPKIHVLLESGIPADKDEAISLIEGRFLAAYRRTPHFYYCELLKHWEKILSLSLKFPDPTYGSAILTCLPRIGRGSQSGATIATQVAN